MNEVEQLDKCREKLSHLKKQYNLKYPVEDYVKRLMYYGDYNRMLCEHWEGTINQLAVIIYKLSKDVPFHKQRSFVYGTLSIFDPFKENLQLICDKRTVNIGQFPCLLIIDLKF